MQPYSTASSALGHRADVAQLLQNSHHCARVWVVINLQLKARLHGGADDLVRMVPLMAHSAVHYGHLASGGLGGGLAADFLIRHRPVPCAVCLHCWSSSEVTFLDIITGAAVIVTVVVTVLTPARHTN
mmetsp:Transcript_26870/g.67539  ORF Transcript_26870/g.67539 Transcript_26870/m.67539 type:complete len:128 (-) Transcript_26870:2379-2762(-)